MPWYRTGTVAITAGQTTVTGTGTNFTANARVGDAFQGPDGRWYEVTNIPSATVLSILPAYQGPTVNGGVYVLAPMQGYVKESADRLRQLIEQFGTTIAGLGTVSTKNVVPVDMGGTGGTTAAEGRAGLGLGDAATKTVGTAVGNVMAVGAGGWLGNSIIDNTNMNNARQTGLYSAYNAYNSPNSALQLLSTDWGQDPRWQSQLALGISTNKAYFRSIQKDQSAATQWAEFYHTGNTTRASDGTLKAI